MCKFSTLLIVLLLAVFIAPSAMAQEKTDFERLMAEEIIKLDWGDGELLWDDNLPNEPAAQLIAEFVLSMAIVGEERGTIEYVISSLLRQTAPSVSFYGNEPWHGVAASTIQWDSETMTLTVQATQFLPADAPTIDGVKVRMGHNWGCGGGQPNIWWTEMNTCMTYEEHVAGGELMPTVTMYRDVFQVVYLPPTEE